MASSNEEPNYIIMKYILFSISLLWGEYLSGQDRSIEIDKVILDYLKMGPIGRQNDPRIGTDRHALIMSGAAILQALLRSWPTHKLSVADRGLREGLLYSQMSADGALREQTS